MTEDFPVFAAGPTSRIALDDLRFSIHGAGGAPRELLVEARHDAGGVLIEVLLWEGQAQRAYAMAFCDSGTPTNPPIEEWPDHRHLELQAAPAAVPRRCG
jgi:hypothetical protein